MHANFRCTGARSTTKSTDSRLSHEDGKDLVVEHCRAMNEEAVNDVWSPEVSGEHEGCGDGEGASVKSSRQISSPSQTTYSTSNVYT